MKPEWTGERLETFLHNETALEHLHRYSVACSLAAGKDVLDLACGEGYGSALLARVADKVLGIDIDSATIHAAQQRYQLPNLRFAIHNAVSIENLGESFDLIVCFETLEHINEQEQLMKVFKKLLRPEGLLIISTPDKLNYSDRSGYQNPFHLKELYEDDFKRLITSHFSYSTFYRQNFIQGSLLQPESHNGMMQFYQGNYTAIQAVANPVHYWLAIGSDVPIKEPGTSIFQNREFLNQVTEEDVNAIKSSLSYRLGHFLLTPFKWIRNLLR